MAIILQKDTFKLQIEKKVGIGLMTAVGFLLAFVIFSNIYWLKNYDESNIAEQLKDRGVQVTIPNMDAFVRAKILVTILGNTAILGLFSGIVWWSIRKRRLGIGFGGFWIVIFMANAISTPFYGVQVDTFTILTAVANAILSIYMIYWVAGLIAHRQRLRQKIASRRK